MWILFNKVENVCLSKFVLYYFYCFYFYSFLKNKKKLFEIQDKVKLNYTNVYFFDKKFSIKIDIVFYVSIILKNFYKYFFKFLWFFLNNFFNWRREFIVFYSDRIKVRSIFFIFFFKFSYFLFKMSNKHKRKVKDIYKINSSLLFLTKNFSTNYLFYKMLFRNFFIINMFYSYLFEFKFYCSFKKVRNNIFFTFFKHNGKEIVNFSAGLNDLFKGKKKKTPYAAYKIALYFSRKVKKYLWEKYNKKRVIIVLLMSGRSSSFFYRQAMQGFKEGGLRFTMVKDNIFLKHGDGVRKRKKRRL